MKEILLVAWLKIHSGQLEAFKQLAAVCLKTVREKDSDILQYEWFLNEHGNECIVFERYHDSEAVLKHLENFSEITSAMLGLSNLSLEVYGMPSEVLNHAMAKFGIKPAYSCFQSL